MKRSDFDLRNRLFRLVAAVAAAVSLGLLAGPLSGQEPPPRADQEPPPAADAAPASSTEAPRGTFVETVEVKVTNVYVYVRDKKGNPITGLTKDDFEVYEDKNPVTITNFYEVDGGKKVGEDATAPTQLERIKSHPELDPRVSLVPADQRLHVIVYVDHFNIRPQNRNRVFRYLRDFLRQHVTRDDRVMLVSYNRSLKVERQFTSDPQLISRALLSLEKHTGGRTQLDSERKDLLRDIQEARDPGQLRSRIRLYAESQYNDLQFTLDALKQMVEQLGGLPGRKALIYVSDGLPMRAGEDLFVAATERYPGELSEMRLEAMQYDSGRRFRDLAGMASANQVAFYTLDASGLLGRSSTSAEYGSYQASSKVDGIFQSNMQQPLQFLADFTGGQAIVNTNNFAGGFERFARDFDHYYSLGYTPSHAGTGREYNLRVKVNVKGAVVRFRRTYRDKPIEREMAEATLAALQFGYQQNDLGIRLKPTQEIKRTDGNYLVHVDVEIPLGELVLLPHGAMHEGRLRLWVQAADGQGRISDVNVATVPIEVAAEDVPTIAGKYWVYQLPLMMRPGDQRLSVAVRDDVGAKTSFVTRTFRVGS